MNVPSTLDLSLVPPGLRQRVRESFVKGEAIGILCCFDNTRGLDFVWQNAEPLRDRGIFEEALLHAFTACRTNNRQWSLASLDLLFGLADREKLLRAGDPPPAEAMLTLYRGAAGHGVSRKARGYSWTTDLDLACGFALRYPLDDPGVYTTRVRTTSVIAFRDGRGEQEAIVRPSRIWRLEMTLREIKERAAALRDRRSTQ